MIVLTCKLNRESLKIITRKVKTHTHTHNMLYTLLCLLEIQQLRVGSSVTL